MPASRNPIDSDGLVLQLYGAAMLEVQVFERMLGLLAVTLSRRKSERPIKDAADFSRALGRIMPRLTHAFQKATASELRSLLPLDFDPALMAEIEELIPIRTRLAHRYLVEQLANSVDAADKLNPQSTVELTAIREKFHSTTGRIIAAQHQVMSKLPNPQAPPEIYRLLRDLALPVIFGEPWE